MMEELLIDKKDFECIGQVAKHCDWEQLCIFIREQQNLSLLPKIGQCLFMDIYDNIVNEKDDETLDSIWNGGQYIGCDGKARIHFGLKRSLVHWAYGAYIYRHSAVDTPFGLVQKVNQDSVPVEMKEARNMNIEQRNNAKYYFDMTKDFICSVKSDLDCNVCDCGCECSYCAGGGKTLQNRGNRFGNVYKKI